MLCNEDTGCGNQNEDDDWPVLEAARNGLTKTWATKFAVYKLMGERRTLTVIDTGGIGGFEAFRSHP